MCLVRDRWSFSKKLADGANSYRDNSELRLSELQSEVFDGWRRPSDVVPPPSHGRSSDGTLIHGPTTISGKGVDLVQDVTSDCSVVASLCAGMARVERGHTKVLSSIFQVDEARRPADNLFNHVSVRSQYHEAHVLT